MSVAPVMAEPVTIGVDQGATFDAIIDGFPMLALFDGVPDFPTGYNTLSIGLQVPITEERGIGEFPVAPLRGAGGDAIASATLFFNIDDVIGTFGPGTSFRGNASQTILIHLFAGDGVVTVADHLEIGRTAHIVDTKPLGRINDQSLAQSGPLTFAVDVTDDVRALLDASATSIGVLFRTIDSGSATSLDNLGDGGVGPAGVHGSFLPYLIIDVAAAASPTPTETPIPPAIATATTPPTATPSATAALPTFTATTPSGGDPTPTATAPATDPTPTDTAPGTDPTPTTTNGGGCAGDCNGDGSVDVSELITGVNMALGNAANACAAMDGDANDSVSVAELIQAVNAALAGC
ncbi:MAG: hypothetical protein ABI629_15875 [bacterium]